MTELASPLRPAEPEQTLAVDDLSVCLRSGAPIVEEITFSLGRGEVLGLVGESGAGKTTVALALLAFTRPGARIGAGSVRVAGQQLVGGRESRNPLARGRLVCYVPQDPAAALNPSMRVGALLRELVESHRPDLDPNATTTSVLERVHLPADRSFRRRFPHQLSGGQQQRLAIGMAIACEPPLVVLDEPTTGLDVVTQARILEEVARLRDDLGTAMVYVSHNLALVAGVCDRIAVMYAGRIVEEGSAAAIIEQPRHPYSRGLVASIPDHLEPRRLHGIPGVAVGVGDRPAGCAFAPRCTQASARAHTEMPRLEEVAPRHRVRCFDWHRTAPLKLEPKPVVRLSAVAGPLLAVEGLRAEHRSAGGPVVVADDVSFTIARRDCVALVGESGSGKTTIGRCVVGLHAPNAGRILLDDMPLPARAQDRPREARRRVQIVFQNPYDSLNPRHRVQDSLVWSSRQLRRLDRRAAQLEAAAMLERVRLPRATAQSYPRELSGGERQRVAIARALIAKPDLIICDEVTSALDVSVQAAVLELLAELQRDLGLAVLFITHDLGVVANIADRALVLEQGVVREQGATDSLLANPTHEYTRRLVDAAPRVREAPRVR